MGEGQKKNIAIVISDSYNGNNGAWPVTAIGASAFDCSLQGNMYTDYKFTSLDLTNATNLTAIGNKAFRGCSGFIGTLTIPDTVTAIGYGNNVKSCNTEELKAAEYRTFDIKKTLSTESLTLHMASVLMSLVPIT